MFVATVNDDVARFEQRGKLPDEFVDGGSRLDEHHHFAGPLQRLHQVGHAVATDKFLARRTTLNERFDLVDAAIEHGHAIAAALHVQRQILAHDSQANQPEIAIRAHEFVRKKEGGKGPPTGRLLCRLFPTRAVRLIRAVAKLPAKARILNRPSRSGNENRSDPGSGTLRLGDSATRGRCDSRTLRLGASGTRGLEDSRTRGTSRRLHPKAKNGYRWV